MEVKYRSYFLKTCEKAWVSWKSAVSYALLRAISEFVTDLGRIRYKSPCNTAEHLWVSWKSVKWKPCFTSGHEWSFALSTVFLRFGQNSLQEMSTNSSFREGQRSESLILCLRAAVNIYFPRLLCDVSENRYKRSACTAVELLLVSRKST